jgi:phage/plasmid-like protein (TIGR03299 family)
MAHRLHINEDGQASMFYTGNKPWHGLGKKLDKPATAAEAIQAAKLDYEVVKQPLIAAGDGFAAPVPDCFAVVRRDLWGKKGCPIFGIVSGSYTVLQNREAFEFFDPITGKGAAIYHTAGALGDGERIWMLARLPTDIRVVGDDIAEKYLLLSNSHDGTSSLQIKFTPIRVVCWNTLTQALSQGPTVRVAHTKDIHERLKNAEEALGIINKRFGLIEQTFQAMVGVKMNDERLKEYLGLVFPDPSNLADGKALQRTRVNRSGAAHLFEFGRGNEAPEVAGTLWAGYNGVTEYVDYRKTNQSHSQRLHSIWFGAGCHVKERAYAVAQEKIEAWKN